MTGMRFTDVIVNFINYNLLSFSFYTIRIR